jgi:putative sterol carrier protein
VQAGGGDVNLVLTVAEGKARLGLDPAGTVGGTATMVLGYAEALAMARGQLDPADALAAGRVRVRGDLAALVAGQDVLAEAAARLGTDLAGLTDPPAPAP